MSYADRVNVNERPACWGDADSYDTRDADCSACSFQHTCRTEISRASAAAMGPPRVASAYTSSFPSASANRTYSSYRPQGAYTAPYRPQGSGVESANWAPGPISETDNPITRFLKDGVAGAARGGFYEWYRFWQVFRLK